MLEGQAGREEGREAGRQGKGQQVRLEHNKDLKMEQVMVMVTGGSTNAVLHLIAMARAVGVRLTIDDFQKVIEERKGDG